MKSARFARGMKRQGEKGFTLVELIAVVAIISLIAVYITIEINQSNDDAKVGLATAFLASSVPGAISSYKSRHMGSCRNINAAAGTGETLPTLTGETTTSTPAKQRLVARGLSPTTIWDDFWSVAYTDANRQITMTYPLVGVNSNTVGTDLANNLTENPQVVSAIYANNNNGGTLTVIYGCS